jgi:membrane protein
MDKIMKFFQTDIWQAGDDTGSKPLRLLIGWLRKLYLAVRFFFERGHADYAPALSFSLMLAIVPVVAVVFAVARGFGLDSLIETWFRDTLEGQPQAADVIIDFAKSYIVHTRSGMFIGVGLLFMLYSVLSLIYNVEHVFDEIWRVKNRRSPMRILLDYTALLFLIPVGIIVISGVNIFIYSIADRLQAFVVLGPLAKGLIRLLPFVMMSCVFIFLYVFMPNTRVKFSKAVVPGIIAGVATMLFQFLYIHFQIYLTSYNAIYGSFAALPLFMLWLLISWYIVLFCGELCYMNQNADYYAYLVRTEDVSHDAQLIMSLMLLKVICSRFADAQQPLTALELARTTDIPIRITSDLLYRLRSINLITEYLDSESDREAAYQPSQDIANITVGKLVELLDSHPDRHLDLELNPEKVLTKKMLATLGEHRKQFIETLGDYQLKDL